MLFFYSNNPKRILKPPAIPTLNLGKTSVSPSKSAISRRARILKKQQKEVNTISFVIVGIVTIIYVCHYSKITSLLGT